MQSKLHGFLIEKDIMFDIEKKRLLRFIDDASPGGFIIKVIYLNATLVRLLVLLLESRNDIVVSNDDILNNVWESNALSSSNQRLWHGIKELRQKLLAIGLPSDFILSVRGIGYVINSNSKVIPLFSEWQM